MEPQGGRPVSITVGEAALEGDLIAPRDALGLVLFAHGTGSSRFSPRNRYVAATLEAAGFATLLMDLLTPAEEAADARTGHLRFDVDLLAQRLVTATEWVTREPRTRGLAVGYFGASTGAAAALLAAAQLGPAVRAVVSRGGRPDLAMSALPRVTAPTLLIVGGEDHLVLDLNREASEALRGEKDLRIVLGAGHLFEEPGALEEVARLAREWFERHLSVRRFRDRLEAGRVLAALLTTYANRPDVLVLALPRGGVPVADEVAGALEAPLDVLIVRKLGVPGHEELALGAIASGGVRVLNDDLIEALRIPPELVEAVAAREERELARRERVYREGRPPVELRDRTVVLVDDGLATGATMRAAVQALRQRGAARIVVAVPTAARATCEALRAIADDVVCATTPEPFYAVGEWYEDFSETTDDEVRDILRRAAGRGRRAA